MIKLILSFCLGAFFGIGIMAILIAGGGEDDRH